MNDTRKLHETIDLLGLRAHSAAAGMIQLSVELTRAGVLDDAALGRIKDAIFGQICLNRPVSLSREEYERGMRRRLDALFSGTETLGKTLPPGVGAPASSSESCASDASAIPH